MSLLSRLTYPDFPGGEQKIEIDPFRAILWERIRGYLSDSQAFTLLALTQDEQTDFGVLVDAVKNGQSNTDGDTIDMGLIWCVLHMGETDRYTLEQVISRLTPDQDPQ